MMDIVGGYRIVRRLGSGTRADVHLGRPVIGGGESAAVKTFRSPTTADSIDAEIAALTRANAAGSRHLLRIDDLGRAHDNRPVLILSRLEPAPLARLLSASRRLSLGEAVTILAPIAAAVGDLHAVGVAHGGISARTVLFDPDGAPVLASFGRSTLFTHDSRPSGLPDARLAAVPGVGRDLADLAALVSTVLAESGPGTAPERAGASARLRDWLATTDPLESPSGFPRRLEELVFGLAPALPVKLSAAVDAPAVPLRLAEAHGTAAAEEHIGRPRRRHSVATAPGRGRAEATSRGEPLARVVDAFAAVRRVSVRWHLRKPFWTGLATSTMLVVAALTVLPAAGRAQPAAPDSGTVQETRSGDPSPLAAGDSQVGEGTADAAAQGDGAQGDGAQGDAAQGAAITGDDPVAAGSVLLERRERDAPTGLAGAEVALTERLGDSAILAVTVPGHPDASPVTLLLLKSDTGWRIRDLWVG